jgi:alpha-tubulin suppressor-like RCC1 family protein
LLPGLLKSRAFPITIQSNREIKRAFFCRVVLGIFIMAGCVPAVVPTLHAQNPVTGVAAGYGHTVVLGSDGSLWTMGYNDDGQLGIGVNNNTNRPQHIAGSVTAISAGEFNSLFLKSDGTLWGTGDDGSGQFGDGNYFYPSVPEHIVANNVVAIARETYIACFLKATAACGYRATIPLVSWATALSTAETCPRKL